MNKLIKFLSKNKWILNLAPILLLGAGAILYPKWWIEGSLDGDTSFDEFYLKIGAGIAVYGGLIANIIWVIKNK